MIDPSESTGLLPSSEDDGISISDGEHSDPLASLMNIGACTNEDFVPIDYDEMKKVTHNDPTISYLAEDMSKLHGSTRMMINSMIDISHQREMRVSQRVAMLSIPPDARPIGARSNSISKIYQQQRQTATLFLERIHSNFFDDARSLTAGTIPQSIIVAIVVGTVCGIACFVYNSLLEYFLELFWTTLPQKYIAKLWDENYHWLWIPLVSLTNCLVVGLAVRCLGEPGDLPYTISRVHQQAYIPMNHVFPMMVASLFSILAGGSLGPEAPLVAICGALGGFVSRHIFRQNYVNVVRKHTLMGMSGALAAFFGCPLGGSLFALEVNSRFGIEYFEHLVEAIFAGEICLIVFRSLAGLSIAPIWDLTLNPDEATRLVEAEPWHVVIGGLIGLLGALAAYVFSLIHFANMEMFANLDLLDNRHAVWRALLGGSVISMIGVLLPQTMFWGEQEFEVVATRGPANDLPNVWPTSGYKGFELGTNFPGIIVGVGKLFAISFTVAGGLRGGYIFPLMLTGASFGTCVYQLFPSIPLQICTLCMAAGLNTAITRTSLATTLILAFLSGEPCAIPSILAASLVSLFATAYLPFIKTQITRSDIDHSLFRETHIIQESNVIDDDDDSDDAGLNLE